MRVVDAQIIRVKFIRFSRWTGKALVEWSSEGQEPHRVWLHPDDLLKIEVTFEVDRRTW